jgi:hypothetical protein
MRALRDVHVARAAFGAGNVDRRGVRLERCRKRADLDSELAAAARLLTGRRRDRADRPEFAPDFADTVDALVASDLEITSW